VTPWQLPLAFVEYARRDGYEPVVVPEDIAKALRDVTDLDGEPMFDLGAFRRSWNDSFQFEFVDPADLTDTERSVHNLGNDLIRIVEIDLGEVGVDEVRVSETMRLNEHGGETVGQTISTSVTPRFLNSVRIPSQNLAPSVPRPTRPTTRIRLSG
jgi:hypothetical protein